MECFWLNSAILASEWQFPSLAHRKRWADCFIQAIECTPDIHPPCPVVDIFPPKSKQLSKPHTGEQCQPDKNTVTVTIAEILLAIPSERPVLSMVTTMLEKAFAKLSDKENLMLHSDQGWQYQHKYYQRMLQEKGIQQSMSNKGNCLDNAVRENFFGLLKSELLYLQDFESMDHFKRELIEYLDYYNNRCIKARLKGLPPALHRQQALSAVWIILVENNCLTFWGYFKRTLLISISFSLPSSSAKCLRSKQQPHI